MGWNNYASCEINPFGSKVLEYYWPEAYHHGDIHTLTYELLNKELVQRFGADWRNEPIVLTGGFPCQPFSLAGKRKGTEDDRHLWPEMLRLIREIAPKYVVGENVGGIISWDGGLVFEQVQTDLEAEGYEVQPFILPACAVNAPHRRDRCWFVANYKSAGWSKRNGQTANLQGWKMAEPGQERNILRNDIRTSDQTGSGITPHNPNPRTESMQSRENEVHEFGVTSDTSIQGREEWIELTGRQDSEENRTGLEFWTERFSSYDTTPNSNINPTRTPGESGSIKEIGGGYDDEQEKRRSKTEQHIRSSELLRDDADTGNTGLQGRQFNGTSYPEGQEGREQSPGSTRKFHQIGDWSNFPTVSPVCQRDDEFSNRLAGITFSKWRNESIKSLGNAVVPGLVLQIFKAIEIYENEYNTIK